LAFAIAATVAGCGGKSDGPDGPIGGSESHFLAYCEDSCGDGLDCIAGVCTRGCVVDENSCTDLSPKAECTADSIEPGAVAVCDVACSNDGDCDALGPSHRCDGGYCRKPFVSGGGAGGSSGTGGTGGNPDPTSCDVDGTVVESGSLVPNPNSCGYCTCDDGDLACDDATCSDLLPVPECPPGPIVSDDFELPGEPEASEPRAAGNLLFLDVSFAGGCEPHTFQLCYRVDDPSEPTLAGLFLTHDAHGDTCEAYLTESLRFDLGTVDAAFGGEGGIVLGTLIDDLGLPEDLKGADLYAHHLATCGEREEPILREIGAAIRAADKTCESAADCVRGNDSVSCMPGCDGPVVSVQGAAAIDADLDAIERDLCGDCPELSTPACAEPGEIDCVEGTCTEIFP
jgi:hypothetical protein